MRHADKRPQRPINQAAESEGDKTPRRQERITLTVDGVLAVAAQIDLREAAVQQHAFEQLLRSGAITTGPQRRLSARIRSILCWHRRCGGEKTRAAQHSTAYLIGEIVVHN